MLVFAGKDCNGCRHHKNVTFEYLDTDQLRILNSQIRIQLGNIRTIYIPSHIGFIRGFLEDGFHLHFVPVDYARVPSGYFAARFLKR